ncbi:MAG: YbaB/EbfC family nucleoid-associated protein [Legionellales bacterium]|nr:YbaB/EbfC family nucleoid-associated protein [Legionellales bacterium]
MSADEMGRSLNNLLKEAQVMQDKMKRAQEELTLLEVIGKAGGGMVTVTMNGRHEVSRVSIAPSLLEEVDMLQDLVAAATNDAVRQVEAVSKKKINELTAGLNIPTDFMKEEEGR